MTCETNCTQPEKAPVLTAAVVLLSLVPFGWMFFPPLIRLLPMQIATLGPAFAIVLAFFANWRGETFIYLRLLCAAFALLFAPFGLLLFHYFNPAPVEYLNKFINQSLEWFVQLF